MEVPCVSPHALAPSPRDTTRRRKFPHKNLRNAFQPPQQQPVLVEADDQNDDQSDPTTSRQHVLPLHLLPAVDEEEQQQRFLVGLRRSDNNQLLPSLPPPSGKIRDLPRQWGSLGSNVLHRSSPRSKASPRKRHSSGDGELVDQQLLEEEPQQVLVPAVPPQKRKQRRGLKVVSRGSMAALRKGMTISTTACDAMEDGQQLLQPDSMLLGQNTSSNNRTTPKKVSPRGALAALFGSSKKKSPLVAASHDTTTDDPTATSTPLLLLHNLDNMEVDLWNGMLVCEQQQQLVVAPADTTSIKEQPPQLTTAAAITTAVVVEDFADHAIFLDTPTSVATKSTQPCFSCSSQDDDDIDNDDDESYHTAVNQLLVDEIHHEDSFESPCASWEPVFDDDGDDVNASSQVMVVTPLQEDNQEEEHTARGIEASMARDIKTTLEEATTPELSRRMSLMASMAMEVAAAVTAADECRDDDPIELDTHQHDSEDCDKDLCRSLFVGDDEEEEQISLEDSSQHAFITEPPSVHHGGDEEGVDDTDSQHTFITEPPVLDCSKISSILVTPSTTGTAEDALTANSSLIDGQFLLMDDSQYTFITEMPSNLNNKSRSTMVYSDDDEPTKESTTSDDEDSLMRPITAQQLANVFDSEFVLRTRSLASDEEEITVVESVIESVVEESEPHEYFDFDNLDDYDGENYGLVGHGYTDDVSVMSDLTSQTFLSQLEDGVNDKDTSYHSLIEGLHLTLRHVSQSLQDPCSSPLAGLDLPSLRHVTPLSTKHSHRENVAVLKRARLRRARTYDGIIMTRPAATSCFQKTPLKPLSTQTELNIISPSPSAPQRLRRCRSLQSSRNARSDTIRSMFDRRTHFFDDWNSLRSELMSQNTDDASVGATSTVVVNKSGSAKCGLDLSPAPLDKAKTASIKKGTPESDCILDHSWEELDQMPAANKQAVGSQSSKHEEVISLSGAVGKACRPVLTNGAEPNKKVSQEEGTLPKRPSLDQQPKIRQMACFYETVSVSFLALSIKRHVVLEVILEALRILKPGGVLNVLDIQGKIVAHWSEHYPQFDFLNFRKATEKDQEAHETNTLRILEKSGLKARFSRDDPNIVHWTCHKPILKGL